MSPPLWSSSVSSTDSPVLSGRRVAIVVATMGGLGYAPLGSGTFGTLGGVALVLLLPRGLIAETVALLLVLAVGTWAARAVSAAWGTHDDYRIVVDEAAGYLAAMYLLPRTFGICLLAFVLFRVLDASKPGPVGAAERVPGAWGIMLDDLVAGALVNIAIHALRLALRS